MTETTPPVYWDVQLALADVTREIGERLDAKTPPSPEDLTRWLEWIGNANAACGQLHDACEDLVELGATPEHLKTMEQALARAQGQERYWWRKDRW
jgi:hypothetical protein